MGLFDFLGFGRRPPSPPPAATPAARTRRGAFQFMLPLDGELAEAHALVDELLAQTRAAQGYEAVMNTAAGRRVREAAPQQQALLVLAGMERTAWIAGPDGEAERAAWLAPLSAGGGALDDAMKTPLPFTTPQLVRLVEWATVADLHPRLVESVVLQAEQATADPAARQALGPALDAFEAWLAGRWGNTRSWDPRHDTDPWVRALYARFYGIRTGGESVYLDPEPWAVHVSAELEAMESADRARWVALIHHLLGSGVGSKPTAKWLKEARRLIGEVGAEAFRERARAWLAGVQEGAGVLVTAPNADLLRGLVWCLADGGDPDDATVLGDLGMLMARKIPGVGVRSLKVLNGCATSLGGMPGNEPIAQLTRLRARVRHAQAQAVLTSTLLAAAEARGVEPDDLEEMVVPTFGMQEPGVLREDFGEWTAEVRVTGTASVETAWIRPDGKRRKSVPADLKEEHAEELAALKKAAGEMAKMLAVQRDRIEGLPMAERVIPYPGWRERYLEHPLLAPLCRRLIWRFETGDRVLSGAWDDGTLVDADGVPLEGLGAETDVSLWHSIHAGEEEVRAWRLWLEEHGVTQPFKQAHREVYRVTDAERQTGTYSNRFAAHVLRQHQLAALGRERGWKYHLQGMFDGSNAPTLPLPRYGMRAEFVVNPAGGNEDLSDAGISLYVITDRVRFIDSLDWRTWSPMEVDDVPALVLSEVMRDVDLFVGVASVGTDPNWTDRDLDGPMAAYWHDYSFGALSQTAVTRRDVLERLIPRLRIRDVCTLEERFLVVRGKMRTYRIHLGSGNIRMDPNDQYLCIVPSPVPGASGGLRDLVLPFEGDHTLTLILSKAFLLAADDKITDPVITRQIGHVA